MSFEFIETLRSLGFGSLLGGGASGLLYILFPTLFPGAATVEVVVTVGGILGAGTHQLIDKWFLKSMVAPMGKFIGYYSKIVQLSILRRTIGEEHRNRLLQELTDRYFLDDTPGNKRSRFLPPPEY